MTVGETLLKISDYPFAYSFITLIAGIFGYSVTQNTLLVIGIAGAFGTLLTFTDPIGHLIRLQQKIYFQKHPMIEELNEEGNVIDKKYPMNSLYTRAIGLEIDKILGIIYFGISSGLFILVLFNPHSYISNSVIRNIDKNIVCDASCVQIWGMLGGFIALGLSIVFTVLRWIHDLPQKVRIAGIHQLAISNEFPTINSVENMTKAVEQNDWITANEWGNKILDEINFKKGKREMILRAGDKIYRQLHREAQKIIDDFNNMGINHSYSNGEASLWTAIKLDADDVIIEDKVLRNEIISFYDNVYQYNATLFTIRSIVFNVIRKRSSEVFNTNILNVSCNVNTGGGNGQPDLANCAMYGIHPGKYIGDGIITSIDITYSDNVSNHNENIQDPKRISEFDKIWDSIIEDVKTDYNVVKFKKLILDIHTKAPVLAEKYREKIALEWKV